MYVTINMMVNAILDVLGVDIPLSRVTVMFISNLRTCHDFRTKTRPTGCVFILGVSQLTLPESAENGKSVPQYSILADDD